MSFLKELGIFLVTLALTVATATLPLWGIEWLLSVDISLWIFGLWGGAAGLLYLPLMLSWMDRVR